LPEKNWPFPKVSPADSQPNGLPHVNEMLLLWLSSQALRLGFEEEIWNTTKEAAGGLLRRIPASHSGASAGEICFTTHVNRMSNDIPSKDVMPELSRYASALALALRNEILASGYSVLRCSGTAQATGAQTARIRIEVEAGLIAVG
jgi:hypothetical protein